MKTITSNVSKDKLIFFLLLSSKHKLDSLNNPNSKQWKKVINILKNYKIGIHPSYLSYNNSTLLEKEIKLFFKLTGKKPEDSRFHYLRKELPESYEILLENNIKREYTSLSAMHLGFLHGTTFPFFWYNLKTEKKTNLKIIPTILMDRTFLHLSLSPEEAEKKTEQLIKYVKRYGGEVCILLHPEILTELYEWKGWKNFVEKLITLI